MIARLPILALIALASLPASAAPGASRNYGVSGFDRIRVDGPFEVRLTTGVAPFAKASGKNSAALDNVSVKVDGRTLIIRRDANAWGGYPGGSSGLVVVEVGTHDLSTAWLNGAGTLAIDKVKGLSFDLNVEGAGVARINSVAVDQFRVSVSGSGTVRLAGKTLKASTFARGSVNIDAAGLSTKDAVVTAEGPSLIQLTATDTAKVNAFGVASVTLSGNPSCTLRVQGSASVSGCKE
ncbi:GIN domain-containing protein [Sphingomonas jaspsi]|uniref:GIN domain-containing protein n=1 Tax=Sphingomonas jaspsi TaxID=392409 RepID=UPI0004B9790A|nr:DUF2807 domain-containing protein [Sphingomonas jaspsi]